MNQPLQQRAGSNVGLSFFVPSSITADVVFRDVATGDTVLVEGIEEEAVLIGIFFSASVFVYNQSGAALGAGQLLWIDDQGNEVVLDSFGGIADGALASMSPNTKLGAYAFLMGGEKLVLRVHGAVAPGVVASAFRQTLYQNQALVGRVSFDTVLKTVTMLKPGRAALPANLLSSPQIWNLDIVPHTANVYVSEGGVDRLILKNLALPALVASSTNVPINGLGDGQSVKVQLNEPIFDPSKKVMFFLCFSQFDS